MQPFLKRNIPIFIFGLALIVVFISIAIAGDKKDTETQLPALKKVTNEEEMSSVRDNEQIENVAQTGPSLNPVEIQPQNNAPQANQNSSQNYSDLQINFTQNGFDPKVSTGYVGQKVIWTNTTAQTIKIKPVNTPLAGWDETKTQLLPGQFYEFVLPRELIWAFMEENSELSGTIQIIDPNN